jgi:predicted transcriptional regulator
VSWNLGLAISTISVAVELAILEALARHDRLAVERIADVVGAPRRAVASGVRLLAEQGMIRRSKRPAGR